MKNKENIDYNQIEKFIINLPNIGSINLKEIGHDVSNIGYSNGKIIIERYENETIKDDCTPKIFVECVAYMTENFEHYND